MSVTTLVRETARERSPLLIVERLFRDRDGVWQQIHQETGLGALIGDLLATAAAAFVCYGAVMGASHGTVLQALSSAVKLPLLYLLTLAICLPTLYLFNLLCGGRLTARQALALALVAAAVTAALTLAFAPITLFFLITARDYAFFKLLNVGILALTGLAGLNYLIGGMRRLNALERERTGGLAEPLAPGDAASPAAVRRAPMAVSLPLLPLWLLLYGFVGTQLGWTLAPFFGYRHREFVLFENENGSFYADIAQTLFQLLR